MMANMVINLRGDNGQLPAVSVELIRQGAFYVHPVSRLAYCGTPDGLLSVPALSTDASAWHGLPVAANLPTDNFEVLLRTIRMNPGTTPWDNGGGGVMLTEHISSDNIDDITETRCYYMSYGSDSLSSGTITTYIRDRPSPQVRLNLWAISYNTGQVLNSPKVGFLRLRREAGRLKGKAWYEKNPNGDPTTEPTSWAFDVPNNTVPVSHVFLFSLGQTSILFTDLAIGTEGDTATLAEEGVPVSGVSPFIGASYPVQVLDYATHMPVGAGWTDSDTGGWAVTIHSTGQVYARVDGPDGPVYDFIFAAGSGYLSGSFPDGITRVEGAPASAKIRVLLRLGDGNPLDGAVIADIESEVDGTWLVTGLNPALKYDVICRHEGYNDMILSNVSPVVD